MKIIDSVISTLTYYTNSGAFSSFDTACILAFYLLEYYMLALLGS